MNLATNPHQKQVANLGKTALIVSAAGLLFLGGYTSGQISSRQQDRVDPVTGGGEELALENFELLVGINDLLQEFYFQDEYPEAEALVEGAAKGLVGSFNDPYTTYYTPEDWADLQSENSGQFQGVGIVLVQRDSFAQVETPIAGSPAARAGLLADDLIIAVDGESVADLSIGEIAELIRGEAGTAVELRVFRSSADEELDFTITREEIDLKSIEFSREETGAGARITITKFTESNLSEFRSQWDRAVDQVLSTDSEFVILDLRNNTGGWVAGAQYVLEEFLEEGTVILREVDKDGEEKETSTSRTGRLVDKPMIVLVNGGSASASEIVAGAIQDLGRGELIGTATRGKGVEQTVQETPDGGRLFIVFKQWLTPSGRNLSQSDALQPDIVVEFDADYFAEGGDNQLEAAVNQF